MTSVLRPARFNAAMAVMATITLPAASSADICSLGKPPTLQLHTVNGNTFDMPVRPE
jgi:thiosulfate dehydrogenase (quinone)